MYVFVFMVAVTGNLLVILVVYCNANLWSSTNRYLVNLAIADLLVAVCCTWVHLVRHLSSPHYVLPAFVCRLDSFLQATALSASVLTLTAISVGRFVAVMFPLRTHTSPDRAYRVILVIWLASALLASPSLLYRQLYSIQWKDMQVWHCDEFWPMEGYFDVEKMTCIVTSNTKKLFYTFFIIAIYFMPVTVMVASYSLVVWRLWASQLPGEHCAESRMTVSRSKKKVVKMVTVVVVVFVICWTPLQSLILYTNVTKDNQLPEWFDTVEYMSYFIAHANSAINPIIYCSFNSNLRRGLMALLACRHGRRSSLYHRRMKWRGMTAGTRETTFGASAADAGALTHTNLSLRKGHTRVVLRSGHINGSVKSANHHGTPQELLLVHNDQHTPIEVTVADTHRIHRKMLKRNSSAFSVDSSASSLAGCGCCSGCRKRKRNGRFATTHRHSNDDIPDIVKIQTVNFNLIDMTLKKKPAENDEKNGEPGMSDSEKCTNFNVNPEEVDEDTPFGYEMLTNNVENTPKVQQPSQDDRG
ncbi:G protein-coupled receptor rhodopsin-like [Trinorchestia longiramus]|nr:G protein-coupled receptor rhodopsin-like [Trinorchestia longiramus]